MKKKAVEFALLSAILILSCLTLVSVRQHDNTSEEVENRDLESLKSERFLFDLYVKQSISESVSNDNRHIDAEQINRETDMQNDKPVLVFRHSAMNCNVCVEFAEDKLKAHFPDYRNNPDLLVVVSDYTDVRKMKHRNFVDLKHAKLGLPIENASLPFYFVLINDAVQHVFIPEKDAPQLTDLYLQEIRKRYFITKSL